MTSIDIPVNLPAAWPYRPAGVPSRASHAMVATTDRLATEVGVAVLREGGNAVDAAVAVGFALAVVNPEAGNLAGSGFLLARAADGAVTALDFRSVAPRAATADMFLGSYGALSEQAQVGPLAAAVPGSVMGLWDAHQELGSLPWRRLLEPAVALARGFPVTERLASSYPAHIVAGLRRFPESARIFLPGGDVPRVGDAFQQPDLARTLKRIRDRGAEGFYGGETADLLVEAVGRAGGILDHEDLATYSVKRREPVTFAYRDYEVLSMPPSSSGGVALAETGHMLSAFDLGALPWHGPEHIHLLAEVWKRAFADRNHYLADADFAPVPFAELAARAYGGWRGRDIRETATPAADVGPGLGPFREGDHTTHVSIVDGAGNAVALTTTLNTWYGSKFVAEGTGVLLNNEMDDFTAKPGTPNHFGLIQGDANVVAPGKRMLSAMTPTLVVDPAGRLFMVLGAPGGATIITTVFQVIANVLDHGMSLAEAVAAPRVHHQHLPDHIDVEPGGVPDRVQAALEGRGHEVVESLEPWGDAQAVMVLGDGGLEGAADPRRGGAALGY